MKGPRGARSLLALYLAVVCVVVAVTAKKAPPLRPDYRVYHNVERFYSDLQALMAREPTLIDTVATQLSHDGREIRALRVTNSRRAFNVHGGRKSTPRPLIRCGFDDVADGVLPRCAGGGCDGGCM